MSSRIAFTVDFSSVQKMSQNKERKRKRVIYCYLLWNVVSAFKNNSVITLYLSSSVCSLISVR